MQHHQEYNYDADDDESGATTAILQRYLKLHPPSDNPNLIRLAKLAASGIWTSSSGHGPALHILGLICMQPNLFLLFSYYWKSNAGNVRNILYLLPLNIFPLFVCNGIPALKALSVLCIVCGVYQYFDMKYVLWRKKMKV